MLKTNLKTHLQPKRLVGICYFDKRFCFYCSILGVGRGGIRGEVFIFRSQEHGVGEGEGGFNFF